MLKISVLILTSALTASANECLNYKRVYCKATTDRIALIRGPVVKISNCAFEPAIREALDRLWFMCGGVSSPVCKKPATCLAIDDNDVEYEIGKFQ